MSARVLGLLAGGLLIIALWAGYERRHPHPLINVRRVLNLSATPAFFIAGMCGAIAVFTNPAQVVYLQMPNAAVGHGLSQTVLQVAYVLRAVSIAVVVGGFVTAPLITRFAPPRRHQRRSSRLGGRILLPRAEPPPDLATYSRTSCGASRSRSRTAAPPRPT